MESFFLKTLQKTGVTKKLGDDCVLLEHFLRNKKKYIIAMDSFVEDIHFRISRTFSLFTALQDSKDSQNYKKDSKNLTHHIEFPSFKRHTDSKHQWLSYENLATKAFLVNISDIFSSGAAPRFALLSISLSKNLARPQIAQIITGIAQICRVYGIYLIGGDTTRGDKLAFHITLIGEMQGKYLDRADVKSGDLVAYTSSRGGDLGGSFKALKSLLRYGTSIHKIPNSVLESKGSYAQFASPTLRSKFIFKAQRLINACIDISDGLGNEIAQLEKANAMGFKAFKILKKQVYQSGEEYELLFTFNNKNLNALQKIATQTRTDIHVIGTFGRFKKARFNIKKWH